MKKDKDYDNFVERMHSFDMVLTPDDEVEGEMAHMMTEGKKQLEKIFSKGFMDEAQE